MKEFSEFACLIYKGFEILGGQKVALAEQIEDNRYRFIFPTCYRPVPYTIYMFEAECPIKLGSHALLTYIPNKLDKKRLTYSRYIDSHYFCSIEGVRFFVTPVQKLITEVFTILGLFYLTRTKITIENSFLGIEGEFKVEFDLSNASSWWNKFLKMGNNCLFELVNGQMFFTKKYWPSIKILSVSIEDHSWLKDRNETRVVKPPGRPYLFIPEKLKITGLFLSSNLHTVSFSKGNETLYFVL